METDFADVSVSDLYRESASQSSSVPMDSDDFGPQEYEGSTEAQMKVILIIQKISVISFLEMSVAGAVSTTCFDHT